MNGPAKQCLTLRNDLLRFVSLNNGNLSSLTLAILCQLHAQPQSGYDLKRVFERTPMGHFSSSPGAIYPALKRMEGDGWIAEQAVEGGNPRGSRVLCVTPLGAQVLRQAFLRPVIRNDVIHNMDQLLLKFVFMKPLVGHRALVEFTHQLMGALTDYLAELQAIVVACKGKVGLEAELGLQHGVASYVMHLNWARMALEQLASQTDTSQ